MPPSMHNQTYESLLLDNPAAHILQVTLNRPEVANAFNTQMATDLVHCFEQLALEQAEYRCVILTGAGERAFCAGGDLKERDGMSNAAWTGQHLIYERMIRAVLDCPVPTIAAVNGAAYAGGCELAAGVDFVYAAERARFAMTETSLGIIPGAGGTQTLARALGERRAKELIMSARPFSATEAMQWGLQCTGRGAPGAAGNPPWPADVDCRWTSLRDRSLSPYRADQRSTRGRSCLRRKT